MFRKYRSQQRPNRHGIFSKASPRPLYYEDVYGKYNEDNDAEGRVDLCESESESESEGEVMGAGEVREAQDTINPITTSKERKRDQSKESCKKRPKKTVPRNFGLFGAVSLFKSQSDLGKAEQFTMEGLGNLDDGFPVLGDDKMSQEVLENYQDEFVPENFLDGLETFAMLSPAKSVSAAVVATPENLDSRILDLDDMGDRAAESTSHVTSDSTAVVQPDGSEKKGKSRSVENELPAKSVESTRDLLTQNERAAVNRIAIETPRAQLAAVLDEILEACPMCAQVERESVSIAELHSHAQIQLLERLNRQNGLDRAATKDLSAALRMTDTWTGGKVSMEAASSANSIARRLRKKKQQPEGIAIRSKTRAGSKALLEGSSDREPRGSRSLPRRGRTGQAGVAVVIHLD